MCMKYAMPSVSAPTPPSTSICCLFRQSRCPKEIRQFRGEMWPWTCCMVRSLDLVGCMRSPSSKPLCPTWELRTSSATHRRQFLSRCPCSPLLPYPSGYPRPPRQHHHARQCGEPRGRGLPADCVRRMSVRVLAPTALLGIGEFHLPHMRLFHPYAPLLKCAGTNLDPGLSATAAGL
jgi:hypothetical protein